MDPKFGQTAGIEIIVFFPFVFFKGYVFKFCDVFTYWKSTVYLVYCIFKNWALSFCYLY